MDASDQVIEIASNDGYLLQYFVEAGIPALGIEPAANVAAVAEAEGHPDPSSASSEPIWPDGWSRRESAPTCSSATTCWPMCPT